MRHLSTLLLLILFSLSLTAQVSPRRPYATLSTEPGFISLNELRFGFGLGDTSVPFSKYFFGLTTSNGYQIDRNWIVAGGTGFLVYNGGTLVPLFADVRYKFNVEPVTPFVYGNAGGLLDFSDIGSSKLFVDAGGGAQYAFSTNLAATVGLGVMLQTGNHRDAFVTIRTGVVYKFN